MKKLITILIFFLASLSFYGQGINWKKISVENTINAKAGNGYMLMTNRQQATVTLPQNPTAGNTIGFLDIAGTFPFNNLSIDPGSIPIDGTLGTHTFSMPNLSLTLVYTGSPYGWKTLQTTKIDISNNTLNIDDSDFSTPLIYGEFDNNLVRINGTLDINNAYQFPMADGTANQVLQTNGNGTSTWATPSSGGATVLNNLSDVITTAGNSVYVGENAGAHDDGGNRFNTALGIESMEASTTGGYNTAIGFRSLEANLTGGSNVAIGALALDDLTDGDGNVGLGYGAGGKITDGLYNVAIGKAAMGLATTGDYNIGIGYQSAINLSSGIHNTAIGYEALKNIGTKRYNVGIGYKAGYYLNGNYQIALETSSDATTTPLFFGDCVADYVTINGDLETTGELTQEVQIYTVLNGAKTASFTHDAGESNLGAYTLSTSNAVIIGLHNLADGMRGTIFFDIATLPSAITIETYSDAGTTGLTEIYMSAVPTRVANKASSFTYTCANNGTTTQVYIHFYQEQ